MQEEEEEEEEEAGSQELPWIPRTSPARSRFMRGPRLHLAAQGPNAPKFSGASAANAFDLVGAGRENLLCCPGRQRSLLSGGGRGRSGANKKPGENGDGGDGGGGGVCNDPVHANIDTMKIHTGQPRERIPPHTHIRANERGPLSTQVYFHLWNMLYKNLKMDLSGMDIPVQS